MLTLEMLPEKVEGFPVLYDKRVKVFKEKYSVQYTCDIVILLEKVATGNIMKIAVLKNWCLFLCPMFLQNFTKSIRSSQMLFWISVTLPNQFDLHRCYF